jgi:hypothetical protein
VNQLQIGLGAGFVHCGEFSVTPMFILSCLVGGQKPSFCACVRAARNWVFGRYFVTREEMGKNPVSLIFNR